MRHVLSILVLLGVVVCGTTAGLWVRSHYVRDRLGWESYDQNTWRCRSVLFDSRPGQLGVQIANVTPQSGWLVAQFQQKSMQTSFYRHADPPVAHGWTGYILWSKLGLWLDGWKTPLPDRLSSGWRIVLPYWFLILTELALTAGTIRLRWRSNRTHQHARPGYCAQCGYDLHASKTDVRNAAGHWADCSSEGHMRRADVEAGIRNLYGARPSTWNVHPSSARNVRAAAGTSILPSAKVLKENRPGR